MRRTVRQRLSAGLSAAAIGVATLAGCSGDSVDEGSDVTETDHRESVESTPGSPSPSGLPGVDELRAGLLSDDDLPADWEEHPPDASDNPDFCSAETNSVLGLDLDELPAAETTLSRHPDLGPGVSEIVGFVPAGIGPDVVPAYREAYPECAGAEDDGRPVMVTPLSFPELGDQSVAFTLGVEDSSSGALYEAPVVYATVGDLVIGVFAYDLNDGGDPIALLEEYAARAVDKAARALLGRAAPPAEPAPHSSSADLYDRLLGIEDLPSGWRQLPSSERDGRWSLACQTMLEDIGEGQPEAEVTYARGPDEDPQISQSIALVGDRGTELIGRIRQAMTRCAGVEPRDARRSVTEIPFPSLGDKSQVYRVQIDHQSGGRLQFGLLYALADDTIVVLVTADTIGNSIRLLREYAPVAARKAAGTGVTPLRRPRDTSVT